eukprot:CAMPEP_0185803306 /NCGR_PEP_ID=MMETSP1322-20130828/2548_1 /TAXON_ID=265543 /ORGANISM="Minutocellus polymorphus, Strain RCC2270" /LENGTH=251 /DNA_ID=CAMNT_0028499171 /DNA_START=34 /DNA_END=789 /DNA_ORIENTATION=+
MSASPAGLHLQDLILDTKATASKEQKAEALKLLRVVVKNLGDPTKSQDPKYRSLRLSNKKVEEKLLPCPSAIAYMKAIGFDEVTDDDGARYLRIGMDKEVNVPHMQASLVELTNAIKMVDPEAKLPASGPPSRKSSFGEASSGEEKKTPEGIVIRIRRSDSAVSTASSVASSSSTGGATGKMSEKQKARLLMEKKRQKEREDAKEARKKTAKLIKQDKFVRENDPNWTSKQSAACVKEGSAISTFRDKFGE